jgi:vancomycin resistance protein YoaR
MKVLIPILILLGCFISFPAAAAAISSGEPAGNTFAAGIQNFAFRNGEEKIAVSQAALDSFWGGSLWPRVGVLQKRYSGLPFMLAISYGQPALAQGEQIDRYSYRIDKIYQFIQRLAQTIDIPSVNAVLKIQNNRATEFTPPQNGIKLDVYASTFSALKALKTNLSGVALKIREFPPTIALSQTNSLGINELLAKGESNFKGSPGNRIHNIKVGVEKMKGVIIPPNEEFSFNKFLGPVEAEEGFLPELVIKSSGTVPELGGGLCQVSTTTFRAAMNTGLKITQRKNHAYAVQYYSPQGTDATIYPGVIDLKFINDTPGSLLIWPYIKSPNTLIFGFWGTRDARQVILHPPVQYDKKPDGSMKATWTRDIFNNGTTTTVTFKSTYLPPALFHKTEEFITPTSTPSSGFPIPPAKTQ